jgi:thioredoxin 1
LKELLHFTADWCNPCKKMAPVIEKFISDNPDIKYTKIDVDQEPDLVREHKIQSVPTFIALVDGKFHNMLGGVKPESVLRSIFG